MDFSSWSPGAIACLQYAYHPQLLLTFLLGAKSPPDSYAYTPRPAPSETLTSIFERAYPRELAILQNEVGLQMWGSKDHPHVWGWQQDASTLMHRTTWHAGHRQAGITAEDVACEVLCSAPVVQLLTSLGVNPGGLAYGLGVAISHGVREVGREYLTSAYHHRSPGGVYCVCPWIIGDLLIGGRDDGVLELLSVPLLRSEQEIPVGQAGPVTCISAPVSCGDDAAIVVASGNLVRRVLVGATEFGPVTGLGAPVTALDMIDEATAAVGTADGRLSVLDLVRGTVIRSRKLHGGPASSVTAARFRVGRRSMALT